MEDFAYATNEVIQNDSGNNVAPQNNNNSSNSNSSNNAASDNSNQIMPSNGSGGITQQAQIDFSAYEAEWAGLSQNARRLRKRRLLQSNEARQKEKDRMKHRYFSLEAEEKERVKDKARNRYRQLTPEEKERVKERARNRYRQMSYDGRVKMLEKSGTMANKGVISGAPVQLQQQGAVAAAAAGAAASHSLDHSSSSAAAAVVVAGYTSRIPVQSSSVDAANSPNVPSHNLFTNPNGGSVIAAPQMSSSGGHDLNAVANNGPYVMDYATAQQHMQQLQHQQQQMHQMQQQQMHMHQQQQHQAQLHQQQQLLQQAQEMYAAGDAAAAAASAPAVGGGDDLALQQQQQAQHAAMMMSHAGHAQVAVAEGSDQGQLEDTGAAGKAGIKRPKTKNAGGKDTAMV